MTIESHFYVPAPAFLDRKRINNISSQEYESHSFRFLETILLKREIAVLNHPGLRKLAREGKITLAMIKPAALNLQGVSDERAAERIKKEIRSPLEVVFDVAIRFSKKDVEEFYSFQKEGLLNMPPVGGSNARNRWEQHVDYMSSGATTILLLYSPDGDAIKEWRDQIGHWDVINKRDPATIRGRWAVDTRTSLVHGSDSPESVLREVGIIREHLERLQMR